VYHAFSLGAWGFLYIGFKHHQAWQAERERALQAEKQAADARLRALQYQLNPHFFFNTLNAISTLVTERRNDEASAMIARLGDFLRATLRRDGDASVPLRDELEFTRRYLDIERIRFEHRLAVSYDVATDALDAAVPVLLLQPLVENAIRHGIAPIEEGGTVAIGARLAGKGTARLLEITIDNDAKETRRNSDGGIGIANVRDRLEMLYGRKQQFSAGFVRGRYHVRIAMPYSASPGTFEAERADAASFEPAHT
jgi:two-component system sensor histidine kinase AlgZ